MAYYQINLKPTGPFFFATELKAELGNRQNYYQKSRLFPQQTTLLGVLRYQLLLKNGYMPIDSGNKNDVAKLIGKQSFHYNNGKNIGDFGVIKQLSPIFLNNNNGFWSIRDKEFIQKPCTKCGKKITSSLQLKEFEIEESYSYNLLQKTAKRLDKHYLIKDEDKDSYNPKYPFSNFLYDFSKNIWLEKDSQKVDLNKITLGYEQVGIHKRSGNAQGERGYYKMDYKVLHNREEIKRNEAIKRPNDNQKFFKVQLKDKWYFTYFVEMEDGSLDNLEEERYVVMGKEQSVFKMSIIKSENNVPFIFEKKDTKLTDKHNNKLIFVSDTFIESESHLYDNCTFANIELQRLRFMQTQVSENKKHYYGRPSKSKGFNLIKRGSVVYGTKSQINNLMVCLDNMQEFKQIGYNYYITQSSI